MKVRKDRKVYVSLALHQAISAELTGHPERVRQLGLEAVQKVLPHNPAAKPSVGFENGNERCGARLAPPPSSPDL